jgi:hypothetical protein
LVRFWYELFGSLQAAGWSTDELLLRIVSSDDLSVAVARGTAARIDL